MAPAHIFVFDGTGFTHLPPLPEGFGDTLQFRFLVGVDAFPVPFIYFSDGKGIYGIPTSGPLAGIRMTSKGGISISEPYGTRATPSSSGPLSTWTVEPKRSSSGSTTGAVIGGVCAVVVVVIAVLGFLFYRRKRQLERIVSGNQSNSNNTKPIQPTHTGSEVTSTGTMVNTSFAVSKEEYPY